MDHRQQANRAGNYAFAHRCLTMLSSTLLVLYFDRARSVGESLRLWVCVVVHAHGATSLFAICVCAMLAVCCLEQVWQLYLTYITDRSIIDRSIICTRTAEKHNDVG